jgi:hypothetical protein
MRSLLVIITLSASACSYTPVADLRASGDAAQLYQRDVSECRQLIKEARSIWHKPLIGPDPWLDKCLAGRGHSIIGG